MALRSSGTDAQFLRNMHSKKYFVSFPSVKSRNFIFYELHNYIVLGGSVSSSIGRLATISSPCIYNGSVVKTKIWDFYNELIGLISYRELRESSGTLPCPIYAKLHMAAALLDSSIQPVSDSQVRSVSAQSCRCGYTVQWRFWLPWCCCTVSDKLPHIWNSEPSFNHDIVSPAAFTIHALTDLVLFEKVHVLIACKLTALIWIHCINSKQLWKW